MQSIETLEERQKGIEKMAQEMGAKRYHQQLLPWQASANPRPESEGMVGRRVIAEAIPKVSQRVEGHIQDTLHTKKHGGARHATTTARMMERVGPDEVAYAGLKGLMDRVSQKPSLTNVARIIGRLIETQDHIARMDDGSKSRKAYAQAVLKNAVKNRDERYRRLAIAGALRNLDERVPYLEEQQRIRMGMRVLGWIYEETGLFDYFVTKNKGKPQNLVGPTQKLVDYMENAHEQAEKLFPLMLPMVCPPKPWTGPYDGGYLTDNISLKLVKTRNKAYLQDLESEDIEPVLKAVNAVQETPWKINQPMLRVIRELWQGNVSIGKLPPRENYPLPAKPEGMDSDEELRKEWRRQAAAVHSANANLLGKRAATAQKLWIADYFKDEEAIYFPHQLDWRGRIYPAPALLTPQGDDLTRGMLQFARAKPLGEEGVNWLAIHLANTWGNDKVPFEERIQWAFDNQAMILDSAMFPTDGQMEWTEADEPFQFLAACFEWLGYTLEGSEYESRLPVAMDGSCSGLQHFSAMLRDEVGAKATNVLQSDRPQDIYQKVADLAHQGVVEDAHKGVQEAKLWVGNVDRKVAKRPTMTLPYGVTKFGMTDQIKDFLKEQEVDGKPYPIDMDKFHAAKYITGHIDQAITETVVSAKSVMDWLQKVAKVAAQDGLPVSWTTPAGLPVQQGYRKTKQKRINCHFGGINVQAAFAEETEQINKRRQASGIAPNYVHSMDASHLMLTVGQAVDDGLHDFAVIHDSFGCHAADAGHLGWAIRKTFVDQYTPDRLEEFRQQIKEQLPDHLAKKVPEVPEKGDLDIESVMDSMYFFA